MHPQSLRGLAQTSRAKLEETVSAYWAYYSLPSLMMLPMHICTYAVGPAFAWERHVASVHIFCPASLFVFRMCSVWIVAVLILLFSVQSRAPLPAE